MGAHPLPLTLSFPFYPSQVKGVLSSQICDSRPDHGRDQNLSTSVGRVAAIYDMLRGVDVAPLRHAAPGRRFAVPHHRPHGRKGGACLREPCSRDIGGRIPPLRIGGRRRKGGREEIDKWARENQTKIGNDPKSHHQSDTPLEVKYD
ncbi:hypothetical protein PG993_003580 [Apiospora rasikravindrae]|uniref:Uncharacterized protein n=1 Tax=Apiospora rasikravindrae TaxID=990691 RepID=A0ABR1TZY2_9PEZI